MHSVRSVPLHGFASCTEKLSGEWVKAAPDPKGQAHEYMGFPPCGAANRRSEVDVCCQAQTGAM